MQAVLSSARSAEAGSPPRHGWYHPGQGARGLARRPSKLPLYEFLRAAEAGQRDPAAPSSRGRRDDEFSSVASEARPGSSGRLPPVVRIPIGFVFVAGAMIVVLGIGLYMAGFSRAQRQLKVQYEEALLRLAEAGGTVVGSGVPPVRDPLASSPGDGSAVRALGAPEQRPQGGPVMSPPADRDRVPADEVADPSARPIEIDASRLPRAYYLVIMSTNREGAERLVRFCREHDVDAAAIRRQNVWLVILLRGYPTPSDPDLRQMRTVGLPALGARWRTIDPGRSDFSDAYPLSLGN